MDARPINKTTHGPLRRAVVVALLLGSACGGSAERTVSPVSAPIGSADAVVGDLSADGVRVVIPSGAVEQPTTFSVRSAVEAPRLDPAAGALIGTPYDIDVELAGKRFDEPLSVTFQLTDRQWDSLDDPAGVHVGYHDGATWVFLAPTEIDGDRHTVTVETFHCSLLSPAEPSEAEIRELVAHDVAVVDVTVDKNAALRDTTESLVKSVMGDNVDTSLLRDIVEGMLDQNDYTQLLKSAANGNADEFQTQFIASYTQVTANALWAYSAAYAGDLGDLGANLGLVGAFGSSAALVADGDYQAAAEELARGIIQTTPMGKLLLTTAKVTQRQIERWKNEEIAAAYEIYLHGKEPTVPFWGYGSIEAGDFDQIWVEMRGVGRQMVLDAVADFAAERGHPPSDAERAQLEHDVRETLRSEFENRKAREEDIAKAEAKNLEFLEIARDGNLLTWSRYGFERGTTSYRDRVQQILDLRNRVLADTARTITFGGEDTESEINAYTVSRLITTFVRDGEAAYEQLLAEEGFVEGFDLSKAIGTHTATLTFSPPTTTFVESFEGGTSTWTSTVQYHDAPITVTVGSDATISLSYTVGSEATREVVVDYQTGFVSTETISWTFAIDETFDGIAFGTAPGAATTLSRVPGDRLYRGTYATAGRSGGDVSWDIEETFVTTFIDSLSTSIDGSTLVVSGSTVFAHPELGMGPPVAASFRIEIDTA